MEEKIKKTVSNLLEKLGVEASFEVKKEDEFYKITIDSTDNALLIGKHGNTLSALQYIISLILANKEGKYLNLILEIGDWREKREQYLSGLAQRLSDEVLESGREREIRGLKPWERRFVHILLKEKQGITTQSVGEGEERTLVIKRSE
jgi:spoIIIJ-associated protein